MVNYVLIMCLFNNFMLTNTSSHLVFLSLHNYHSSYASLKHYCSDQPAWWHWVSKGKLRPLPLLCQSPLEDFYPRLFLAPDYSPQTSISSARSQNNYLLLPPLPRSPSDLHQDLFWRSTLSFTFKIGCNVGASRVVVIRHSKTTLCNSAYQH